MAFCRFLSIYLQIEVLEAEITEKRAGPRVKTQEKGTIEPLLSIKTLKEGLVSLLLPILASKRF